MVGEARCDQRHHLAGDGIRRKAQPGGQPRALRQRLAVVGIEIPLAADRLALLHEKARLPPHLPIEELHAEALAALGPAGETAARGDEAVVLADLHRQAGLRAPGLHHGADAPLARLGRDDALDRVAGQRPLQLAGEAAGVLRVIEADVIDRDPLGLQLLGEVPHRREDEDDLLLVVGHVAGLVRHLDHQHHVAGGVEAIQRRDLARQLVAEDDAQDGHVFSPWCAAWSGRHRRR